MEQCLNLDSALEMLGGEKDLLKELMTAFINDEQLDENKLKSLENETDTIPAAVYVHYFKGAARQLGGEKFAAAGQMLEDVLRHKAEGDIPSLHKAVVENYTELLAALKTSLAEF